MIESADVVLLMVDGTEGTTPDTWALLSELGPERTILVWNKSDLATPPPHWYGKGTNLSVKPAAHAVISARKGEGLETLAEAVRELALARSQGQEPEPVSYTHLFWLRKLPDHTHTFHSLPPKKRKGLHACLLYTSRCV